MISNVMFNVEHLQKLLSLGKQFSPANTSNNCLRAKEIKNALARKAIQLAVALSVD